LNEAASRNIRDLEDDIHHLSGGGLQVKHLPRQIDVRAALGPEDLLC
jgi:hypothetical protein